MKNDDSQEQYLKICSADTIIDQEGNKVIYCTGTSATDQINIDTKGDFKPHYNITKPDSTIPYLNIGPVHTTWNPDQDYKINAFQYDSIGAHRPLLNIDTDDDGLPDINIDIDGTGGGHEPDGEADINIDLYDIEGKGEPDNIPDINIDGIGDGKPDYNLDPDDDGRAQRMSYS